MTRKLKGIRRKRNKWQTYIRINGQFYSETFDLETPIADLKQWLEDQVTRYGGRRVIAGSFEEKVNVYLKKPEIAAMASIDERAAHLKLWLKALGRDRRLASITRDDVEGVLQGWLRAGLSSVTVYHRRTALRSLFVTINGDDGYNPVTGTTKPAHWHPIDRSVEFPTLTRIIDAMPDTRAIKKGIRQASLAKLAARALLHTGMPPAELFKLRRPHFEPQQARMRMPWRDKGEGRDPYWLELAPEAIAAFVAIDGADVWGKFPPEETISRSFKRAARRILGPHTAVRLYDLRHSMGTDLYRKTGDLPTVGRLLGHVEGSIVTAQYALGAHADVDRAAIATVSAARAASLEQPRDEAERKSTDVRLRPRKLPKPLPAVKKWRQRKYLRRA